jgi:hypothetical protein
VTFRETQNVRARWEQEVGVSVADSTQSMSASLTNMTELRNDALGGTLIPLNPGELSCGSVFEHRFEVFISFRSEVFIYLI